MRARVPRRSHQSQTKRLRQPSIFRGARLALVPLASTAAIAMSAAGDTNAGTRSAAAGMIAFHRDPNGADDLFVIDATGKHLRRLTRNLEQIATPAWSPNGRLLGFLARPSGQAQVYVVGRDGRNIKRLTKRERRSLRNLLVPRWTSTRICLLR
jgi:hypothetical protein